MTTRIKTLIHRSNASIPRLALASTLVLMNVGASRALAQDGHSHAQTPEASEMTKEQLKDAAGLIKVVRDATRNLRTWQWPRRRGMPFNSAV